MTSMESIGKLRELRDETASKMVDNPRWVCARAEEIADEVEREIAEKYMERPCDMDGVPIKIGDELSHDGFARNFIVHSYELVDGVWKVWDVANGATHICSACRHVKSRTVEDVLEEFLHTAADACAETNCELEKQIAKYADELRGMMEVRDD